MVAWRDMVCAMAVGEMSKMGCFEEEFITYGCAFWQEGRIKYLVTGKGESMEDFLVECALKDWYPTPVQVRLDRSLVAAGEREEIRQNYKLDMVRDLRRMYDRAFFDAMAAIAQVPANDNAYPLLMEMQEELDGRFDDTALRLYEDLTRLALKRKVLSREAYLEIAAWLADTRSQMADDAVVKEQNSRTFAGFASLQPDGRLKYYVNAQPQTVQERQREEAAKGLLVTPVLQKTYWFKTENMLMAKRQEFEALLKSCINESYMSRLQAIHKLPTELAADVYQDALQRLQAVSTPEAVEAFKTYGRLWGVEA